MIVLFIWLIAFTIKSFFYDYLNNDKLFLGQIKNKVFLVLVLFLGILSLLKIIDVNGAYFFSDSFKTIGLSNQIDQCFILIPLLILFSQILETKSDGAISLLVASIMIAMTSYNLNIIFTVFFIYEFFSMEKRNQSLKAIRKEIIILLLVIFPFVLAPEKIFSEAEDLPGIFFLLLALLNLFDIWSIGHGKNDKADDQFQDLILISPLRMAVLVYCASNGLVGEYLNVGKVIFLFGILASFFYGLISHFNLRSLIIITQTLFLASSLSILSRSYIEFYFLLNILVIYNVNAFNAKKNLQWPLLGLFLIILLSLIDGQPSLIRTLTLTFKGDHYSKVMSAFLLLLPTIMIFQWGQSLKKIGHIKIGQDEKYYIFILVACVALNIEYNMTSAPIQIDWTNKIIVFFYFIIALLVSYIVNIPKLNLKVLNKYFLKAYHLFEDQTGQYLPSQILEGLLRLSFRGLLKAIFFVQGIFVNFFLVLVDLYEYRGVKKYQHLAMFLLITFLFLWMKVFVSSQ